MGVHFVWCHYVWKSVMFQRWVGAWAFKGLLALEEGHKKASEVIDSGMKNLKVVPNAAFETFLIFEKL